MKAIRTLTSPKSSPRLPATATIPASHRSFHNTPQESSSSQLSTHQHPSHQRPKHDTGKMSYSSSSSSSSRASDGIVFDEDVIEELRPILAERARTGEGRTGKGQQMRGMGTGQGAEWVW
ncbi:hypothetical protein VD0002_g6939 [Verticillium dahliae]|uniref:Uncharacterized protein n=2 Tax=Verticillium dahliae TaxID=27337 RepID=G2X684_VERDV|nr:uncharacterized protein VDAG_05666 [Verticillium dahliae VdLs.17]KAF3345685.1 hypothetical protein VdG2_05921 [Verticillium dahliae VDG2]KAH6708450.1 hypothetical protein EV126DRAFT_111471 [Verticillium dahliae]EGY14502.1 hypothetical protein VDAG_05666 [Verticillium dahliae VdLs.17]PNH35067.1 hypothetical protein BJF96_g1893 [Verticillium dahliae]PNH54369.1 hypothetical protein VD0003_g3144 [Verticillium dahliae]